MSQPDPLRALRRVERHIARVNRQLARLPAAQRFELEQGLCQGLHYYETQRDRLRSRPQSAAHVQ